ncbi:MAG: PilZ domain-containing protein [Hyphomicrobiaceae bacterium]|nr:PilZ domain-containing protein [Hyphomicrobiaceae bacterium]
MTLTSRLLRPIHHEQRDGLMVDQRRYRRVALALLGRFMRSNKQEYPCKLVEMSVGGAQLMSPIDVHPDEPIVVYLDQIGGLKGTVVRSFEGGFAIKFEITAHKREKLAAQLTWLINRKEFDGIEEREHERFDVVNTASVIQMADGRTLPCTLADISVSGASIVTKVRPPIGSEIGVGMQRAIVRRHHDNGIGVQFLNQQDFSALKPYLE